MELANRRKRKRRDNDASGPKRTKLLDHDAPLQRDVLHKYYSNIITLREHVLKKLPGSSRLRRKKIQSLGKSEDCSELEKQVAGLLDTSLVCVQKPLPDNQDTRWEQWLSFSQKADDSHVTLSGGLSASIYSQSEVWPSFPDQFRSMP